MVEQNIKVVLPASPLNSPSKVSTCKFAKSRILDEIGQIKQVTHIIKMTIHPNPVLVCFIANTIIPIIKAAMIKRVGVNDNQIFFKLSS